SNLFDQKRLSSLKNPNRDNANNIVNLDNFSSTKQQEISGFYNNKPNKMSEFDDVKENSEIQTSTNKTDRSKNFNSSSFVNLKSPINIETNENNIDNTNMEKEKYLNLRQNSHITKNLDGSFSNRQIIKLNTNKNEIISPTTEDQKDSV